MSCHCDYDYDMPSFYNRETRRARKQHRCCECSGIIAPGDKYEYVSGKWDWFSQFRTCSRCVDLRTWVANNLPCFCWAHGNLIEDAREAVYDAVYRAGDEVKGIRFGLARRIHSILRRNRSPRVAA